ncbi:MAG: DUF1385 domain-containing protein [Clostridiales bacterium]|nr:DUF1385 domain-containing protein [Clostridiales bacterium]
MSNKSQNNCKFKSKIGGQALIEGVMMKGIDTSAMAVRLPNGEIDIETWAANNGKKAPWYKKTPFVRGIFNFVSSLIEGYKCLSKSADKAMIDDDEEQTKFELWLDEKFGEKIVPVVSGIAMILGVALAAFLFMYLPALICKGLGLVIPINRVVKTILEGVIRITIFVVYIAVTALSKDIKRTYEYHGAEHKTIACYEAELELNVENVKKQTRFHPRCGTSFIFLVLIISILVSTILPVPWDNVLLRMVCKLPLIPVIVGIAYEIIRIAGKYDNIATRVISFPGLQLQRLTTREPDDKEIEVAIASLLPCIPKDTEDDKW